LQCSSGTSIYKVIQNAMMTLIFPFWSSQNSLDELQLILNYKIDIRD